MLIGIAIAFADDKISRTVTKSKKLDGDNNKKQFALSVLAGIVGTFLYWLGGKGIPIAKNVWFAGGWSFMVLMLILSPILLAFTTPLFDNPGRPEKLFAFLAWSAFTVLIVYLAIIGARGEYVKF